MKKRFTPLFVLGFIFTGLATLIFVYKGAWEDGFKTATTEIAATPILATSILGAAISSIVQTALTFVAAFGLNAQRYKTTIIAGILTIATLAMPVVALIQAIRY